MSGRRSISFWFFGRVHTRLLAAIIILYVFFALQYWLVLWITSGGARNAWKEALIDYFLLKAMLTLPLAWLYFKRLQGVALKFKILLHLITGTLWVYCWFQGYRVIQDWRNGFYLEGDASWWDVYIPGLFYCVQFLLYHLYELYLQVEDQKEIRHQLAEAALQSEINLLKSQIQPHFLFNTLNSISASVPPELEATREMIAKLADNFRYCLRASTQEYVQIGQELSFIRDFLDLEKERFRSRLGIKYVMDQSLSAAFIPPMLIQPLIENSIKHGIGKSIDGGIVELNIQQNSGKIRVIVSDTGNGYPQGSQVYANNTGTGLQNISKRLMHLFGETLLIEPNHPRGTIVSFIIPLLTAYEKR